MIFLLWIENEKIKFYGKFVRTAKNFAIDMYRKNQRSLKHGNLFSELPDFVIEGISIVDEYDFLLHQIKVTDFMLHTENDVLYEALKELSEEKGGVIVLSSCYGITDKPIGEQLRIPTRSVCYIKHTLAIT